MCTNIFSRHDGTRGNLSIRAKRHDVITAARDRGFQTVPAVVQHVKLRKNSTTRPIHVVIGKEEDGIFVLLNNGGEKNNKRRGYDLIWISINAYDNGLQSAEVQTYP